MFDLAYNASELIGALSIGWELAAVAVHVGLLGFGVNGLIEEITTGG